MKYRNLIIYAVSFLALTLFLLTPLAAEPGALADFPGAEICQDLFQRVDRLVTSRFE